MKYVQKKLGYKRAATKAAMRVKFDNGDTFDVPLQIVADNRDENYKDDKEDTVKFIREGGLTEYDLEDWFRNNMNWEDVADYAIKVDLPKEEYDYGENFSDAECDIEGEV